MKRITLLFIFCGLLMSVTAHNLQYPEWKTYLKGHIIDDMADAGDYLWIIADLGTKILKFEKKSGNYDLFDYKDFNIRPDDWFCVIECDNNGFPWVGTFAGAFKMTADNSWVLLHSGYTEEILATTDRVTWIAYQHELVRYEGESVNVFDKSCFSSLATNSEGNLWGTRNGLVFWDLWEFNGRNWNSFTPPFELFNVWNLTIDKKDKKWMSDYGGLLISYDDMTWRKFYTPEPTQIYSIATDNSSVWCGTMDGLMQFYSSQWTIYNTENSGLPSNIIYDIQVDSDGTKWLGTDQGLVTFSLTTSIGQDSKLNQQFELFPNPAHDYITLKIPGELQNSTVDILNIQGTVIKSIYLPSDQNNVDVSHFPVGIYLVRIQLEENNITKKFIKQ